MDPVALEELSESIKQQGVMQPIVVRPINDSEYEIIAGERRWRATQLAELPKIPAIIRDVSDNAAIAMALIENIQREDLNAMEEALALQRLQEEFELTQHEIAEAVGKSRSTVANLLRLLNLNSDVRLMLEHGDLEMGHGRALVSLEGDLQQEAAEQVVSKSLSVRQTEALVKKLQTQSDKPKPEPIARDADVIRLEEDLSERIGSVVSIKQKPNSGKGSLVIQYNSLDELDGILAHIK